MDEGLEGALKRILDDRVTVFHSTPTVYRQLFAGKASNGALQNISGGRAGRGGGAHERFELFSSAFPGCVLRERSRTVGIDGDPAALHGPRLD